MDKTMMTMLAELLLAIIAVCLPILAKYVASAIKKVGENAAAETDNLKIQQYIKDVTDAVAAAVVSTNQTYVDALKEAGEFTAEAQAKAFEKAMNTAASILAPETVTFIKSVYGDLEEYLTPLIEAKVNKEKQEKEVLAIGLPE